MGIAWIKTDLPTLREKKLREVNEACEKTIHAGIDVEFEDIEGKQHFSLEATDQINLAALFTSVTLGATTGYYHPDGGQVRAYSAYNIAVLYAAAKGFIAAQTGYCNLLKRWIERASDEELANIQYGDSLPDDLDEALAEIYAANNKDAYNLVDAVTARAAGDEDTV
jgi:hypothetical protein